MAKKKTLAEKIQKEMDKLEALHEKEEDIMERMRDLVEDDDSDDLFDEPEKNSSLSGQYMSGPKTRSKLSHEKRYYSKKSSINKTNWGKTQEKVMVNKNPIRMFFSPIEALVRGNIAHTKNIVNYYSGKNKQKQRAEKRKLKNTIKNVSDNL